MIKIAPSILSADFANLERDVRLIKKAGAHYVHIDVMDGIFVPNISIGPPVIKSLRKVCDMVFDVHLMINEPVRYIEAVADSGADIITVHLEACRDIQVTLNRIRDLGVKAGISIKPETGIDGMLGYLEQIDLIQVMTVNPGFGGQDLLPHTLDKIKKLRHIIDNRNLKTEIEADGGVTLDNAPALIDRGVDVLVAGSAI